MTTFLQLGFRQMKWWCRDGRTTWTTGEPKIFGFTNSWPKNWFYQFLVLESKHFCHVLLQSVRKQQPCSIGQPVTAPQSGKPKNTGPSRSPFWKTRSRNATEYQFISRNATEYQFISRNATEYQFLIQNATENRFPCDWKKLFRIWDRNLPRKTGFAF